MAVAKEQARQIIADNSISSVADVREKWGKKYPYAISNWEYVNSFFHVDC